MAPPRILAVIPARLGSDDLRADVVVRRGTVGDIESLPFLEALR